MKQGGVTAALQRLVAKSAERLIHSRAPHFIPMGLFIKAGAPDAFWTSIGKTPADFPALTWENFFLANLVPVTIGNIIGGSIMVGAVYWFVYLRRTAASR